jgi:hypothetical protein
MCGSCKECKDKNEEQKDQRIFRIKVKKDLFVALDFEGNFYLEKIYVIASDMNEALEKAKEKYEEIVCITENKKELIL